MTSTARLNLPLIDAGQAQKNVTHNEAILALDQYVQASVLSQTLAAPPVSNSEGDSYIVAAAATGAWAGKSGQIAAFQQGAWNFYGPAIGCLVWVVAQSRIFVWNGTVWSDVFNLFSAVLQNTQLLGIGTTASPSNPLSAKLNAALFTALATSENGTGDMRFTLNKSTAGNTVSQLYQDGYSGRAETGLCGDDHFHIKVSADGATWCDAVNINPASGAVSLVAPLPVASGGTGATSIASSRTTLGLDAYVFRNRLRNATFAVNQRVLVGTITLAAGAYGHDGVKAGAGGATYTAATSGSDTTLTITAGSLILPVETNLIEGGSYILSHAGSAQARVWQGTGTSGSGTFTSASSTSPLTVTLAAATQTNVEFSTGTVLRPQFEPGAVPTAFERRPFSVEYLLCQRYYLKNSSISGLPTIANGKGFVAIVQATTSSLAMPTWTFPTPMCASPTVTLYSSYSGAAGSVGNLTRSTDVAATVVAASTVQCTAIITGSSLTAGDQLACFMTAVAEI